MVSIVPLLGINPASNAFEKIIIKPQPVNDLNWQKGVYESVRGKISSEWKKDQNEFKLNISIPANTSAEVWLPATDKQTITEAGKSINGIRYENGYAIVNIGSGNYSFIVTKG
jgi:alpha-L-rhamnosidase